MSYLYETAFLMISDLLTMELLGSSFGLGGGCHEKVTETPSMPWTEKVWELCTHSLSVYVYKYVWIYIYTHIYNANILG